MLKEEAGVILHFLSLSTNPLKRPKATLCSQSILSDLPAPSVAHTPKPIPIQCTY